MNKPLTNEQIWGLPEEQLPQPEQKNFFDFVDIYGEQIASRFFGIEIPDEVKDSNREEKGPKQ